MVVAPGSPLFTPGAAVPQVYSAEQVKRAEALRAEAMELLYSKDPAVKSPKKAFEKFQEAAKLGDPISADQVGGYYAAGIHGIERSCPKAIEWFEQSAQGGYPLAVNNLAYMLVTCPEEKKRDPDRAEALVKFLFQNNPGFMALLDTYAAVLAEQGHFSQAAKTLEVVADVGALADANPERLDEIKDTMKLYQKGKKLSKNQGAGDTPVNAR